MTTAQALRLLLDRARETPRPWDNQFHEALERVTTLLEAMS